MRGLNKRIRWAYEILEHCSADIQALANCTPHPVCNMIRNRKTQIDSAKAILAEIIDEKKKEEKQHESAPSHRQ